MANPNLLNNSALTGKILASTRLSGTTSVTVYTVPANNSARVTHGVLCNTSTADVLVSVALVPSGGTDDGTHNIMKDYTLKAKDSIPLKNLVADALMGPGDFVAVTPGTTNVVCVVITGVEATL